MSMGRALILFFIFLWESSIDLTHNNAKSENYVTNTHTHAQTQKIN